MATLLTNFISDEARLAREIENIDVRLEETGKRDDLGAYRAHQYLRQLRRHKSEQLRLLEHRRAQQSATPPAALAGRARPVGSRQMGLR